MKAAYFYLVWIVAIVVWGISMIGTLVGWTNGTPLYGDVALGVSIAALIGAYLLGRKERNAE